MNLTKLFNGKYLIQNLKKSNGLLIILTLIVPVLTALVLISNNTSHAAYPIYQSSLSAVNILGMYAVPFILSIILAGYIYKRNSVDFINSMPMNRKTIYFTNFIGGVIIILLIQILTLIVSLICSSVLHQLYIAKAMIFDVFVVMSISYIFVYSVCMLAQTVSGNSLTQIVVVALILFLIPFLHFVFTSQGITPTRIWEVRYEGGVNYYEEYVKANYTMPSNILVGALINNKSFYNEVSMAKMVVLTIIYLILGMFLFNKRKMENVGASFNSYKAHYFVKALTLVPIVFIACMSELTGVSFIIAIVVTAIYYVIYDFVVSKRVKFLYTIIGFVFTIAGLLSIYKAGMYFRDNMGNKEISVNDIAQISIKNVFSTFNFNPHDRILKVGIDDEDLIKEVIENSLDWLTSRREAPHTDIDYSDYQYTYVKFKLKNGREIFADIFIKRDTYEKLINIIKSKSEYAESFKNKNMVMYTNRFLSKEDTEIVQKVLENNYFENKGNVSGSAHLEYFTYDNHEVLSSNIDIGMSQEVFEIVARNYNKEAIERINEYTERENDINCHITKFEKMATPDGDFYKEDNISIGVSNKVKDYIKNHYEDTCDLSKDFYEIRIYGVTDLTFITNINPEMDAIIEESGSLWQSEMQEYYEKEAMAEDVIVYN